MKFLNQYVAVLSVLLVASIACNYPSGGQTTPTLPPPPKINLPDSFEEFLDEKGQLDPATGSITVTLSESELTGYLIAYLDTQSNPILTNPRVVLANNQVEISGKMDQEFLKVDTKISLAAVVDSAGNLDLKILAADFGPIPAPQSFLSAISSMIDEALTGTITTKTLGIQIENIQISDGFITITGRKR